MSLKNARELRKNATDCERLLWLHLRGKRLQGFKFKRQQPLGNYIVDFVCFQTRLIVEADGGQYADQVEYDTRRDEWLKSQGFKILRFWNNDILTNTEGVLATILKPCMDYADTPSPHPLPHQGGGAKGPVSIQDQEANGVAKASDGDRVRNGSTIDASPNSPLQARKRNSGVSNGFPDEKLPSPLAGEGPGERGDGL